MWGYGSKKKVDVINVRLLCNGYLSDCNKNILKSCISAGILQKTLLVHWIRYRHGTYSDIKYLYKQSNLVHLKTGNSSLSYHSMLVKQGYLSDVTLQQGFVLILCLCCFGSCKTKGKCFVVCFIPRPASRRDCSSEMCDVYWRTGPWRPCTAACGNGFESRKVDCVHRKNGKVLADQYCMWKRRPMTWQRCNITSCGSMQIFGYYSH